MENFYLSGQVKLYDSTSVSKAHRRKGHCRVSGSIKIVMGQKQGQRSKLDEKKIIGSSAIYTSNINFFHKMLFISFY